MRRLVIALTALIYVQALATPQPKPPVPPEVARNWEILGRGAISNDGKWVAYRVSSPSGEGRLVVRGVDSAQSWNVPNAIDPAFSADSKWVGYRLTALDASQPAGVALRSLADGSERRWNTAKDAAFLGSAVYMVLDRQGLSLVGLETGELSSQEGVTLAVPNGAGDRLAVAAPSDEGGTDIEVVDVKKGAARVIAHGNFEVRSLVWAAKSDTLAWFATNAAPGLDGPLVRVIVASAVGSPSPALHVFDPVRSRDLPQGTRIADSLPLILADSGPRVSFSIVPWTRSPDPSAPSVVVWNTKDRVTAPEREVEKTQGLAYVWSWSDGRLVQVTTSRRQSACLAPDLDRALVGDPNPYQTPAVRELAYRDVWSVDTVGGERKKLLDKALSDPVFAPDGRRAAVFRDRDWWLLAADGKPSNLTEKTKVSFADPYYDLASPYRLAALAPQWLDDGSGLVLFDGYDAWLARADGGVQKLTNGRASRTIYRREPLGRDWPMYFRTFDEKTKNAGLFRLDRPGEGKSLASGPFTLRDVAKAKNSDRLIYTSGSFANSPNLFVADGWLRDPKPLSNTNPWQRTFAWGRTQLLSYKSPTGRPLNASLIFPAGYEPGRKYPMVAYVYERLSDSLNEYYSPNEATPFNPQMLSQEGYFVLMPDIAYDLPRQPGQSADHCLDAALDAALAKRVGVDGTKVGVIGYSWGGYEAAYVTTVDSRFAVGVCGSGLTDFASFAGLHHWKTGLPNTALTELMQPRMGVPMWDDPKAYLDSSVIWQSPKRKTPLLIQVADKDDIVDWHQGVALYNALRRLGKDAIMLQYKNDGHGAMRRENQLDFARRMRHFLDVYLKGAKPEPWVAQGYGD